MLVEIAGSMMNKLYAPIFLSCGIGCASSASTPMKWMDISMTPEDRASELLKEMTLQEKIAMY
jgi:hypothetical protein